MKTRLSLAITSGLLLVLALVPVYARWVEEPFLLTFSTRALVLALAALSLNIVLGFGGMVSFGHALYLGLGAYSVGILASHGVDNGALQLLVLLSKFFYLTFEFKNQILSRIALNDRFVPDVFCATCKLKTSKRFIQMKI